MKKTILSFLLLLSLLLVSCQETSLSPALTQSDITEPTDTTFVPPTFVPPRPPENMVLTRKHSGSHDGGTSIAFSYCEMYELVHGDEVIKSAGYYSELYVVTAQYFQEDKIPLFVPCLYGKFIETELMGQVYSDRLFGLPCLDYTCEVLSGKRLWVRIAFPTMLSDVDLSEAKTFLDVMNILQPSAVQPSGNVVCSEKTVTLADGREVAVFIWDVKDSWMEVGLYIDGVLIWMMTADNYFFARGYNFFSHFSIEQYTKEDYLRDVSQK